MERKTHCLQVYNAIITLQNKATTDDIERWIDNFNKLKNEMVEIEATWKYENSPLLWTKKDKDDWVKQKWNHTLSKRTIQRCIESDPRIIKNRRYYSVDEQSRYETRYLDPKGFGLDVYHDVIGNKPFAYNDKSMLDMITRFGAIIMFNFIEASRPFEDKKMTARDRDDLVEYWAQNSVPLSSMFDAFRAIFNSRPNEPYIKPVNEMEQPKIEECLKMLEKCCSNVYNDLAKHKKKSAPLS
jgi:hypothetical protein